MIELIVYKVKKVSIFSQKKGFKGGGTMLARVAQKSPPTQMLLIAPKIFTSSNRLSSVKN